MQPVNWVHLIAQESEPVRESADLFDILGDASFTVMAVMCLLVLASISSWFLIAYKTITLRGASKASARFVEHFWNTRRFDELDLEVDEHSKASEARVFRAGYMELRRLVGEDGRIAREDMLNVERALRRTASSEISEKEDYLPYLATVGSAAPFVGLFGTVWGIMTAFMDIHSSGSAGIDVVAGPIAEALVATAIGLLAAIPAVMAYNFLSATVERQRVDLDGFMNDFMNVVERSFVR